MLTVNLSYSHSQAFQAAIVVKNLPVSAGDIRDTGSIPGLERSLEKEMATHSSLLAWRIPWSEKPSRLQSTEWKVSDITERLTLVFFMVTITN